MASTAHSDPEMMKEHFCDSETLDNQAAKLADWIKSSRHFIGFSGAGISTSAGIPDFRGPQGVWTMRAQGKSAQARTSTTKAFPTPSHMALVELQKNGYLKFMISQNTDGIHRRSGLKPECLAELHGNTNLEFCKRCGKDYLRDYRCRNANGVHEHQTDRMCSCGGHLYDTIINFSENLPEKPLKDGFENSEKGDLVLVLGSSLTVSPACDMPKTAKQRGARLVICNLQKTPLDSLCDMRIFAKTDDLMIRLMDHLELEIPQWNLSRQIHVNLRPRKSAPKYSLIVSGIEPDGTPASILSAVELLYSGQKLSKRSEPFEFELDIKPPTSIKCDLTLQFMGHFNEPPLLMNINLKAVDQESFSQKHRLGFNPRNGEWKTELIE